MFKIKYKKYLFLIPILVVGLFLFFALKKGFNLEKFNDVKIVASCPTGHKQFTDTPGNSVCCKGKVNYSDSTCKGDVCSLKINTSNPKNPGKLYTICKK